MRRPTREIRVGNLKIGGDHPVRIQSMTTTPTHDVGATTEQIMRLADSGCEIVRMSVQGKKEARACEEITNQLAQQGYNIPLVADIHFYPPAALLVAEYVDKVRINPGNYLDKRATFKVLEYDDITYALELERIEEGFMPLVEKCQKLGRAMRIGVNHGSLSDRIMNRFGDNPRGMVESALEYARICRKGNFHNFLFSMKSSNPLVMVEAYRLLVKEMDRLGWDYPLHLGVTESGSGQEGRVKSAVGIGTLLLSGIGDTIRVSLTEDPCREIEPAKQLAELIDEASQPVVVGREKDGYLLSEMKSPIHCVRNIAISRAFFANNKEKVMLKWSGEEESLIRASAILGALLLDGCGSGVHIEGREDLCLDILQATRRRMSKTDFIACPSCGRTLFDLQTVTERIKSQTQHLAGVKIAIMGCIVNGPGEMVDSDFGYVGSKPGKIDLYVGKECVEKNIDESVADQRLIELIKKHNRWQPLPAD